MRPRHRTASLFAAALLVATLPAAAQQVLPRPEERFGGTIGRTYHDSQPDFPQPVKAPKDAPNILLILLDDVGFGQASTFGGPVATPTLDRLAKSGLRYNRFHTTALCSPTRAALLTGRNHHSVATGVVMELGSGYPGYNTIWPKSAASIAEILRQNGYSTSAYGKWHNTPDWETSAVGPFDRWPTHMGFEYFYGFFGGDTNQWDPALIENTRPIAKPRDTKDYHFTTDMTDKAIAWLRTQQSVAPDRPFFVYYAPGATHAPHHVPKEWIDKYKGKFDHGWDRQRELTFAHQREIGVIPADARLTPRPQEIPAWDSLSADQQRLYARMHEVFAGFLEHTDHEIGRVVDAIEQLGELDNTLVVYIVGDNGASAEGGPVGTTNEIMVINGVREDFEHTLKLINALGGPHTSPHYPVGWAHAGSTPFQWMKQVASHFGGTRNPLVISWPKRITDKGGIRTQFHHVIDIVPTILEAVGLEAPGVVNGVPQKPIEGVSMTYTFDGAEAKGRRTTQYFEMLGHRAIYHQGWVAGARHGRPPWDLGGATASFDQDRWELYNIEEDFSQADNLAGEEPQKLRELQDLWFVEAAKYNVLPLDDRLGARIDAGSRPNLTAGRTTFTYYPGSVRLPEGSAPNVKGKSHRITAEVGIPASDVGGVLATQGGRFAGYSLFVQDGRPVYVYNLFGKERVTITSSEKIPVGKATVRYEFTADNGKPGAGGTGRLFINDKSVGEGRIEHTVPFRISLDETFDVGEDTGTPVTETYAVPSRFTGRLEKVTVELQ